MTSRKRSLGSAHCVGRKAVSGVLLFSLIFYGLFRAGNSNLAVAGTGTNKQVQRASSSLQRIGWLAPNTVGDDPAKQDPSWRTVWMRVTGYCPCRECCGRYHNGITASGHRIQGGDECVAADK